MKIAGNPNNDNNMKEIPLILIAIISIEDNVF